MKNIPKISVVMPNYNGGKYIVEAIESILNQTFTDFEFIIIDDGSTDNSWEIIQEYVKKDDRIVAIKNEKNLKICKTLNKGIELAKGEYIARMDSDDISLKDRFEKQIKFLDKNKEVGIVGGNCIFIDGNGKKGDNKYYPENNIEIINSIWFRNPLLHPSVIFRKRCFEEFGGYDENFLYAEDLEFWIKFGQKYKFYNLQENILYYRIFGSNTTLKKQKLMIQNTLKVRKKAIKLGYKITFKGKIFYIGTWFMQFLPPKFVLWLFNLIRN